MLTDRKNPSADGFAGTTFGGEVDTRKTEKLRIEISSEVSPVKQKRESSRTNRKIPSIKEPLSA
jgi:hypothetical protein